MPDLMHHITDIARCAALYRQEELAALGLKACHASYLAAICDTPGITQDQLARRIFINKSNVARQLASLEEDGIVDGVVSVFDCNERNVLFSVFAPESS